MFEQPAESPFAPGNHDKDDSALRQYIVFRLNEEIESFFNELETWAPPYIEEHSERLLGKTLTPEQVDFGLVRNVKRAEGRQPLVKFKLNMPGSSKPTRCWDENKCPVEWISDWVGKSIKLKMFVSHLWVMGSGSKAEFGFVVIVTGALEEKQIFDFPF